MQGAFEHLVLEMAVIFGGASLLGTVFVWLKQPIILAYILLGIVAGPFGLSLIINDGHINAISTMGIILLMFLLGLHLHPTNLFRQLKQTAAVTFLRIVFTAALVVALLHWVFHFTLCDALISGIALSFSSTVISLKLIPTTTLHHKRVGEVMISILLFEDILAILAMLLLYGGGGEAWHVSILLLPLKMVVFALCAWLMVRYVVLPLFRRFDIISDYIFLVSLGWCLTAAELADWCGLSHEIGAFLAGVTLATSPIALVIAEGLKPLREFFLILFFFSVGAQFNPFIPLNLWGAILAAAAIVLLSKPYAFRFLLTHLAKERPDRAMDMGLRLGQSSEFSLLLACGALAAHQLSNEAALVVEGAAIVTFVVSTYVVVWRLPTPISSKGGMRSD